LEELTMVKDLSRLNYLQGQIDVLTHLVQNVGTAYGPYLEAERYLQNEQRERMTRIL
jgi:hypothetical protein